MSSTLNGISCFEYKITDSTQEFAVFNAPLNSIRIQFNISKKISTSKPCTYNLRPCRPCLVIIKYNFFFEMDNFVKMEVRKMNISSFLIMRSGKNDEPNIVPFSLQDRKNSE